MPTAPESYPQSSEELLRLLQARDAEVGMLKLMVEKLKLQIARRNRADFAGTSERFEDLQGSLLETQPLYEVRAARAASQAANAPQIDRSVPGHLPREQQEHRPQATPAHHDGSGNACGCAACGGRLRLLGNDISEQLEYVPARFKVIRHVRPKLACTSCQTIFQAAAPSRPIARGLAGAGLLAHVMVAKYCDHLPLHRQSRIYAREGVDIDRSTMAGWVNHCEQLLDPLVAALGRYVMAASKVHADDTPVKVLQPGAGKTKQGRLWVYVRDDRPAGDFAPPAAWFGYTLDRKGEHPRWHLKGFRGTLQADAYGGWRQIYASGAVVEAACWAHARRPWWDIYCDTGESADSIAAEALRRIRALYDIEDEIRGQPPHVRREQRQARAGPLLAAMHEWLASLLGRVSAKSQLARRSATAWRAGRR